jgi:hypothetical protein
MRHVESQREGQGRGIVTRGIVTRDVVANSSMARGALTDA